MKSSKQSGFTLVEVVVALAVLVILTGVIFTAHAELIRAADRLKSIEESRHSMSRMAGRVWLGTSALEAFVGEPWEVAFEPVQTVEGTNTITWYRWTLTPSNGVMVVSELYMREPLSRTKQ